MAITEQTPVLRDLEGEECPWDEECPGTLERDEYKGDDALVCPVCDTPVVRIW